MRTLNLDHNLAFHEGFCTAEGYIPTTYLAITPTLVTVTTQAHSKVEKKREFGAQDKCKITQPGKENKAVPFAMARMKPKGRTVGKHLPLTHTITLTLSRINRPDPHPNPSPQLSPLRSALHSWWIDRYHLLASNS